MKSWGSRSRVREGGREVGMEDKRETDMKIDRQGRRKKRRKSKRKMKRKRKGGGRGKGGENYLAMWVFPEDFVLTLSGSEQLDPLKNQWTLPWEEEPIWNSFFRAWELQVSCPSASAIGCSSSPELPCVPLPHPVSIVAGGRQQPASQDKCGKEENWSEQQSVFLRGTVGLPAPTEASDVTGIHFCSSLEKMAPFSKSKGALAKCTLK